MARKRTRMKRIRDVIRFRLGNGLSGRQGPLVRPPRYRALEERFPAMVLELKKKGMTLEWLWKQYREKHSDGYQYSQFCGHFQRWSEAGEFWMHQSYKGGECMFVDWAGDHLDVVNADTGQPWLVSVYVGI